MSHDSDFAYSPNVMHRAKDVCQEKFLQSFVALGSAAQFLDDTAVNLRFLEAERLDSAFLGEGAI